METPLGAQLLARVTLLLSLLLLLELTKQMMYKYVGLTLLTLLLRCPLLQSLGYLWWC